MVSYDEVCGSRSVSGVLPGGQLPIVAGGWSGPVDQDAPEAGADSWGVEVGGRASRYRCWPAGCQGVAFATCPLTLAHTEVFRGLTQGVAALFLFKKAGKVDWVERSLTGRQPPWRH